MLGLTPLVPVPRLHRGLAVAALLLSGIQLAGCAKEDGPGNAIPNKNVYFGDLHLHTRYSNDAFYLTTEEGLDAAYTYAKGEPVVRSTGETVQMKNPLDFMAVTEHAEFLGAIQSFTDPDHPLYDHPALGQLLQSPESNERMKAWFAFEAARREAGTLEGFDEVALKKAVWTAIVDAADRHNDPGTFTTFAAYEWTAYIDGGNMHRNVIFKDTKDLPVPFTAEDSIYPEDLWSFLDALQAEGAEAIAIPHNPNMSDGRMFTTLDSRGQPIDHAYAKRRQGHEPVVEITQNKGTSETHPELSPYDSFSDFEIFGNLLQGYNRVGKLEGSYAREGLLTGVHSHAAHGSNPLKFGFIGSTDSHSALSIVEEDNLPGFGGATYDATPESRWDRELWNGMPYWAMSTAGVTGVWAEENTREHIFEALRRRETFATTGPRIRVCVYAGHGYDEALMNQSDWAEKAAATGVPMGAVLPRTSKTEPPQFLVWAAKDPRGANLDRIQIIKGWSDGDHAQILIYDVALSDGRSVAADGTVPPVGNTVNVERATYSNDIGAGELKALWIDPKFDPDVPAFYYVRVIEIPTPRWSTFDAAALGKTIPTDMPATIQERAFSSPIWYEP